MYAEDSTNKAKKRMLKGWAVQFADDKTIFKTSTASTVPQSKAFDNLLDITEEIETQSEILVSDLDKATIETGQARFDTRSNEVVSRLYRDVRKGISALTKTNFKDLPRSDVGKLDSYSKSLSGYYDRLNAIKEDVSLKNTPSGQDFLQEEINLKQRIAAASNFLRENTKRLEKNKQEALALEAEKESKKIKGKNTPEDKHKYTQEIAQLAIEEKQLIARREPAERDIILFKKDLSRLAPDALVQHTKITKVASSNIDFKLILQNYKVFLDTLTDGLRLYNSGLSGKVNKIGETVGSGRMVGGSYIIGGAEYQHRRFM
jgi:hypothetical protein